MKTGVKSGKLTPAGQDLNPVVEALSNWGLQYAMCPPRPGEVVSSRQGNDYFGGLAEQARWKYKTGKLGIRFPAGGPTPFHLTVKAGPQKRAAGKPRCGAGSLAERGLISSLEAGKRREYARTCRYGFTESIAEFWNTFGATGVKLSNSDERRVAFCL